MATKEVPKKYLVTGPCIFHGGVKYAQGEIVELVDRVAAVHYKNIKLIEEEPAPKGKTKASEPEED